MAAGLPTAGRVGRLPPPPSWGPRMFAVSGCSNTDVCLGELWVRSFYRMQAVAVTSRAAQDEN